MLFRRVKLEAMLGRSVREKLKKNKIKTLSAKSKTEWCSFFFYLVLKGPGSKILFYKPKCISTERIFFASVQLLFQIPKHLEFCLGAAASKSVVFCEVFFSLLLATKSYSIWLSKTDNQFHPSLITQRKKLNPDSSAWQNTTISLISNIVSLPS